MSSWGLVRTSGTEGVRNRDVFLQAPEPARLRGKKGR